jgi:asparagine synthase (glutamine-hydrolysing)
MCGIAGLAWTDAGRPPNDGDLAAMTAQITHRGPDDDGAHRDENAALGFRRLAIVDLAGGHQPLSNEDGTVWVVFNGEIYNFPELRHRLEARGHSLRSTGDTEVLVHLYEDEGENFFPLLRGMFALAVWDARLRKLVIGRDRLGQKPLVYRMDDEGLAFASELKSLLALPESRFPRRVDPVALDQYLALGYVPHPRTIFEGVHKLPPAHYAVWQNGRLDVRRYWEPGWNLERPGAPGEDVERLRSLLADAVKEQMVSDVPLGAFLSGGVDSTIVVGLMQAASNRPVKTFSIGFDDPAFDEREFARLAAQRLGAEHHEFVVKPDAREFLPAIAWHFDEPFADSSAVPTWYVARETRREVTVALTGDAGDELFGGYDRYRAVALVERLARVPAPVRGAVGAVIARALPASARPKSRARRLRRLLEAVGEGREARYLRWVGLFDAPAREALYSGEWSSSLGAARAGVGDADPLDVVARGFEAAALRDPVSRAAASDLLAYLPCDLLVKVDVASMANSLECRAPFLDHRVVELAVALPAARKIGPRGGGSKVVLKDAFPEFLPPPLRDRRKMGFGVPIDRWFREELRGELRETLLDPIATGRGVFRPEAVAALIDDHVSARADHAPKLWALLMLELWFRRHVDAPASLAANGRAA